MADGTGRWRPARATAATDATVWLGLLVAIVLILPAATPRPTALGWFLVLLAVLAAALRWRIGPVAILAITGAGLGMRIALAQVGLSDVLTVTSAAIERVLGGGNPYGVAYAVSDPPGAPFPYGPLSLLWYLPVRGEPWRLELAVSVVVLGLLAVRGRPIGLALYALGPAFVSTATDGSNDNSAGLLLLAALLCARRGPLVGGLLLGLAAAFKPYAAAWALPLALWAWPSLAGFLGGSLAAWGPALLAWGPAPILDSLARAQAVHGTSFYSLAAVVEAFAGRLFPADAYDRLRLVLGSLTALVTAPFCRSWSAAVACGGLVYLVTLYTGYWSTFSYLAALAPILCWHLDEWLGLDDRRVRWPADPVGRATAWLDARWPPRDARARASASLTAKTT
jgi:hypothetical protein